MLRDSKALGIVIKTEKVRDKDKLVFILTPDEGILQVLVYGSQKSIKSINVSLYSEGVFSLYRKNETGVYSLKDADILTTHEYILDDFDKIVTSSLLSELVIKSRSCDSNVYKLFAEALDSLEVYSCKKVSVSFILKFLELSGLIGDFESCPSCGRVYSKDDILGFSTVLSVAVCHDCDTMEGRLILPPNARAYIARTLQVSFADSIRLGISEAQLGRIYRYVLRTLDYSFPEKLETLSSGLLV